MSSEQRGGVLSAQADRAIGRRDVLRFGTLAGIGLATSGPLLTGCMADNQAARPGQAAASPPATPTGVLKVGHAGDPGSLDPTLGAGKLDLGVFSNNVYEGLVGFRGDSAEPQGRLAEGFESSPDAREWTFRLKDGITFHDGEAMTSSAVKASFEYYLREGSPWQILLRPGLTFDDSDPLVFRVQSKEPFPDLGRNATLIRIISPKLVSAGPDAVAKKPVGTGPYRFVSYTTSKSIVFEPHDSFRGPGPYLERIEVPIIPDAAARVAALRSGSVDLVFDLAPTDAAALRSARNLSVTQKEIWSAHQLIFFLPSEPADNLMVRQAFAHAIDKEALVKSILGGAGKPHDSFVPLGVFGETSTETKYPFDRERAKQLLAESGLPSPVRMEVIWAPELGANVQRYAQAISSMVKEVGIELKVTQKPVAQIGKEINDAAFDKPYQAIIGDLGWLNGGPFQFDTDYLQRVSRFSELDKLNNQMLATADGDARLRLLAEMQELIARQVPVIPLYSRVGTSAYRTAVQGFSHPKDGFQPDYGPVYLAE